MITMTNKRLNLVEYPEMNVEARGVAIRKIQNINIPYLNEKYINRISTGIAKHPIPKAILVTPPNMIANRLIAKMLSAPHS
jgi:hypothetical protein